MKSQEIASIGKFIISSQLKKKIDYLHRVVGNVEWSGILVYETVTTDMSELKDLVFIGLDIYPMNIGTGAATEFKYGTSIVDVYDNIPEAMESNIGMVH